MGVAAAVRVGAQDVPCGLTPNAPVRVPKAAGTSFALAQQKTMPVAEASGLVRLLWVGVLPGESLSATNPLKRAATRAERMQ